MTPIQAIIIDDEPDAIAVLKELLIGLKNLTVVGTATSAEEGIQLIRDREPNLVFLDVEMPQKNGFDLLTHFPDPRFQVIFATGYEQYAIRAIRHSALDYLVKPIDAVELKMAVSRFSPPTGPDHRIAELDRMVKTHTPPDRIIIPSQKGFHTLFLDQICSIEAVPGNYAFFTLEDGNRYLCTKPLNHYESLLEGTFFFRIHRSFMVNLEQVTQFDNSSGEISLRNELKYPVATRRQAAFRRKMRSL